MDQVEPTPAPRVHLRHSLTFKQALITLLAVLLLGLVLIALELLQEWRNQRLEIRNNLEHVLDLIEGSAAEALYQLHPELGQRIVDGLLVFEIIRRVELRDDFGRVLAQGERPEPPPPGTGFVDLEGLFADITAFRRSLHQAAAGARPSEVGVLLVELSAARLAERFIYQVARRVSFDIARALFVSLVIMGLFYLMLTRPLLRLAQAIAAIDPRSPGRWSAPRLRGHENDELGLVLSHLHNLLASSQQGLDERDRAEAELKALTLELEQRVEERTWALNQALSDLAARQSEIKLAYQRLEAANRLLLESHAYAQRIQRALLPDLAGWDRSCGELCIHWEPLHQVGGDWYWVAQGAGRCLLMVADCTGHGVAGALITLVLAAVTEQALRELPAWDPAELLLTIDRGVRQRLRQDRPSERGVPGSDDGLEAGILVWDSKAKALDYAAVGGILLLCRDPQGQVMVRRGRRGYLGYQSLPPPKALVTERLYARAGSVLYLMTDGVTDQMGGQPPRLLGWRRVAEWLESEVQQDLEAQLEAFIRMLAAYRGDEPRRDDLTLIAFQPRFWALEDDIGQPPRVPDAG